MYIPRLLQSKVENAVNRGKSILLLGPRQTGKTTLIRQISSHRQFTLANPRDRLRYEKEPFLLPTEVENMAESVKPNRPLIIIDEIQKVPLLMDAVQDLIDRKVAQFILTGSSARKLRRSGEINLLPGRVIPLRLDPLVQPELTCQQYSLTHLLLDGSLPEVVLQKNDEEREELLQAYVTIYLEEEVRAEAIARDIGHFARFLELAASESGKIVNFSKLSQEIGISHSTIANYYQILEDCLVAERIEPILASKTRRKLSKTQKYLFYDLGVRRLAAHEGRHLPREQMGHLLEQYIGLELLRAVRLSHKRFFIRYWRDLSGPEVDWVIETDGRYIPIEVKWTEAPTAQDVKHLHLFLREYKQASKGFLVCRTPHAMKLDEHITALPWNEVTQILLALTTPRD